MKKKYTLIGFILEKKPAITATKQVMVTENTTLHCFLSRNGHPVRSGAAEILYHTMAPGFRQQNGSAALYVFGAGDRIGEPYFRIFQQGYLYQDVHQEHRTDT